LNLKIWNVILLGGIGIGIIGCFLPWGRVNPSFYYPWQDVRAGTWIFSGIYTLASLIFAATFKLFFMAKKKLYVNLVVLVTTLIAFFVLETWIRDPVVYEFGRDGTYTVLYGAYVTLLSVVAVSVTALLYLAVAAEKQLSLVKARA
jgi:hypothetical protein